MNAECNVAPPSVPLTRARALSRSTPSTRTTVAHQSTGRTTRQRSADRRDPGENASEGPAAAATLATFGHPEGASERRAAAPPFATAPNVPRTIGVTPSLSGRQDASETKAQPSPPICTGHWSVRCPTRPRSSHRRQRRLRSALPTASHRSTLRRSKALHRAARPGLFCCWASSR